MSSSARKPTHSLAPRATLTLRAHCSISRNPPLAAELQILVSWASPVTQPLEDVEVPSSCGEAARALVPRTTAKPEPPKYVPVTLARGHATTPCRPWGAVLSGPLQHVQVPALGGGTASSFARRTTALSRLDRDVQMSGQRRAPARLLVPGATHFLPRPPKEREVAPPCRRAACFCVPGVPLTPNPLENFYVSLLSRGAAGVLAPRETLPSSPLKDFEMPAFDRRNCRCLYPSGTPGILLTEIFLGASRRPQIYKSTHPTGIRFLAPASKAQGGHPKPLGRTCIRTVDIYVLSPTEAF